MYETIRLNNDEWCYSDSDGMTKYGQHIKFIGACGYVNWQLIDKRMLRWMGIRK